MVHLGYWMYGGIDGVCACVPIFSRGAATDGHALADSTASGHRADSYVSPHASSRVSAAIVHVPPNAGALANHTGYATPTAQHSTLHVPAHTVAHYCHSDTNRVPDGFTHFYCAAHCGYTDQHAFRSTPSAPLIPASAPRVYETTVTLTTYGYPQAFEPSSKDDPIYPYPHLNPGKVGPPAPKNYRAIVLENSYTQVTVLPELGGRIWRIVDKTTGRTVTYQNPVVKPTQWGYRGWWLATGGIEWCLPVEEHGLNEYRPWNASISGASVTVSDHEDRTGLDVAVTISLDAAHSYVTIQPRVTNSTGGPQKIQFWVNAMLALNGNRVADSTRFILPSAQVTVHSTGDGGVPGPGSKLSWPVFKGRDLSRYANWGGHLGFFASPAASGEFVGAVRLIVRRRHRPRISAGHCARRQILWRQGN